MNLRKTFKEAIWGTPSPQPVKQNTIVIVKSLEKSWGTSPATNFQEQVDVYNEDPVIKESINQTAQEVCSTGIFTTGNEKYTTVLSGKTAKQTVDEWNKQNDLDQKIHQVAVELVAFGNSFWRISDGGFQNIPVESIERAVQIGKTDIRQKYDLKISATYGGKTIGYGEFLHFRTGLTGVAPLGSGIILGLLKEPNSTTPSLYTVRNSKRASMKTGFEKFSFGNELWSLEGADSGSMAKLAEEITDMAPTGNRIITSGKGTISLAVPQRTQTYDAWLESIDREFYLSLGAGISPNTEPSTKATAEAIREVYEMKVASLRRVLKRIFEDLWVKILDKLGFNGLQAEVKLHFGSQEIDYATPDIFAAVDKGIISKEEARKILREYMKWRLEESVPMVAQPVVTPKVEALPQPEQKVSINFKISSEPLKVEPLQVNLKAEPLKSEVLIKTEPLKIVSEPQQVQVTVKQEPDRLIDEKKALLNKISEKVKTI